MINHKIYIGQAQNVEARWQQHLKAAAIWLRDEQKGRKHKTSSLLYPAMNKYGINNFIIEVIDQASTKVDLDVLEKNWIIKLNSQDHSIGYNIACGGSGGDLNTGKKRSKETCLRISKSKKGQNVGKVVIHKDNIRRVIFPEEITKYKDEGYVLGDIPHQPLSAESEKKRLNTLANRSPEQKLLTKKKRSASFSGQKNPMYGRIPWNKGKTMPPETREKIRLARKSLSPFNKGTIAVHLGNKTKYISKNDLQSYINNGYTLGGAPRKRRKKYDN